MQNSREKSLNNLIFFYLNDIFHLSKFFCTWQLDALLFGIIQYWFTKLLVLLKYEGVFHIQNIFLRVLTTSIHFILNNFTLSYVVEHFRWLIQQRIPRNMNSLDNNFFLKSLKIDYGPLLSSFLGYYYYVINLILYYYYAQRGWVLFA